MPSATTCGYRPSIWERDGPLLRETRKAFGQVRDQVEGVLESDGEAETGPTRIPLGRRPRTFGIDRDDETLEATPAPAHGKKTHAVQHRVDACLGDRLQHDGEESRSGEEIALPHLVSTRSR